MYKAEVSDYPLPHSSASYPEASVVCVKENLGIEHICYTIEQ